MTTLELAKDAHKFSVAHMTVFPDGRKERLHGHNYYVSLEIELRSDQFSDFVDFAVLKSALKKLCERWDERVLLARLCPFMTDLKINEQETEFRLCSKRYVLPSDEVVWVETETIAVEALARVLAHELVDALKAQSLWGAFASLKVRVLETRGQSGTFQIKPE